MTVIEILPAFTALCACLVTLFECSLCIDALSVLCKCIVGVVCIVCLLLGVLSVGVLGFLCVLDITGVMPVSWNSVCLSCAALFYTDSCVCACV